MGAELNTTPLEGSVQQPAVGASALLRRLPWLDEGTASLLTALISDLAQSHHEVVALILFGSLARHEERPLHSPRPSDVDLLVLVDPAAPGASIQQARLSLEQKIAIHHTIGEREYRHQAPALSLQAVLVETDLADWDPQFIDNVARDGVLLWARCPLPSALAAIASRGTVFAPAQS